jgi:Cytochrome P460
MRTPLFLALLVSGAVVALIVPALQGDEGTQSRAQINVGLSQDTLASIRAGLQDAAGTKPIRERKMVRITAEPFPVDAAQMRACRSWKSSNDPHQGWIHVYVTQQGQDVMRSGKGVYPPGTVILKQKLSDAAGKNAQSFTGMVKREKGYDPGAGDWEFFVMNSEATVVRPPLNVQSCVDCHAPYRATDFVSRRYLTAKVAAGT